MWSDAYENLITRNIGLLTAEQQDKLKNSCVAVCGLGGLGGCIAEILARSGIESFKLLDHGRFEPSNSNRQIFSFTDTNNRLKTEVTAEFLFKINPAIRVEQYLKVDKENVQAILKDVNVVALAVDSLIPILLLSRTAREMKIPLVEGWAMAFGNARVFTENTPTLEEVYNFPTIGRDVSTITPEEQKNLMFQSLLSLQSMEGLKDFYPESAIKRLIEKGEGTTFAPFVWLTCVIMVTEIIKIILGWGNLALAPKFAVYDLFNLKVSRA